MYVVFKCIWYSYLKRKYCTMYSNRRHYDIHYPGFSDFSPTVVENLTFFSHFNNMKERSTAQLV